MRRRVSLLATIDRKDDITRTACSAGGASIAEFLQCSTASDLLFLGDPARRHRYTAIQPQTVVYGSELDRLSAVYGHAKFRSAKSL